MPMTWSSFVELDALHAGGGAAHLAHVALMEPDAHAVARGQHDVAVAASQTWTSISSSPSSMLMALMPLERTLPYSERTGLLHGAVAGGEDQVLVVG